MVDVDVQGDTQDSKATNRRMSSSEIHTHIQGKRNLLYRHVRAGAPLCESFQVLLAGTGEAERALDGKPFTEMYGWRSKTFAVRQQKEQRISTPQT